MSLFYYAIHFAAAAGHIPERSNGAYSLRELRAAARALCAENGPRLEARMAGVDPLTPTDAIRWRCSAGAGPPLSLTRGGARPFCSPPGAAST